jgi:hypothetical protein
VKSSIASNEAQDDISQHSGEVDIVDEMSTDHEAER